MADQTASNGGGGICNYGLVLLKGGTISNNKAWFGGGIENEGGR